MTWTRGAVLAAPVIAAAVGLAAGCNRGGAPTAATAPATARPVELAEASAQGLDQAFAEQKGKVVLVDAWFLG